MWFNPIYARARISDVRFVLVAISKIHVIWTRITVAVTARSSPFACTGTTDVGFVLVANLMVVHVIEALEIAVAVIWFYTIVAWPRTANIGFVTVAGTLVRVAAGISVRPCDNADYNDGYDDADDDSREWNSNRSVTEFSCTPGIWYRRRVRHNCIKTRNDIRIKLSGCVLCKRVESYNLCRLTHNVLNSPVFPVLSIMGDFKKDQTELLE